MADLVRSFWTTVKNEKSDKAHWLDIARKSDVAVGGDDDQVYLDRVPRKPRGGVIRFDMFPELATAIRSKRAGETLVVANFGHFGGYEVWSEVAARALAKGIFIECAETKAVLDGSDPEAGRKLIQRRRGRTMTEKRIKADLPIGAPKKKWKITKAEAIRQFGSREFTNSETYTAADVSAITFWRWMEEWTGTGDKARAVIEADAGNWPPKRKLKPV